METGMPHDFILCSRVLSPLLLALASVSATVQATPKLVPIDFSACANLSGSVGGPVGISTGNAGTPLADLSFSLLDPDLGNNLWVGALGAKLVIKLSVASPKGVYLLMNTLYGQSGIVNASVKFKGSGASKANFKRVGNQSIRDFNNWVFTNELNKKSVQTWWTSNLDPHPFDQTHRIDVHKFDLSARFAGQTLKQIEIDAPADAGPNYMQPLLFAIGIDEGKAQGPIAATCSVP
jgi:hypothetical protein